MECYKISIISMSWTLVGKKNKKYEIKQPSTAEELYDANINKKNNPVPHLINTIIDDVKNMDEIQTIETLGAIAIYALETMSSAMKKINKEVSDISDNQQALIKISSYTENIKDVCHRTTESTNCLEVQIDNMNAHKKIRMDNIKQFLEKCGMVTKNDQSHITISPDIQTDQRKTYASAIGSTRSAFVVDRTPVRASSLKTESVDMGIATISIVNSNTFNECVPFTIQHIRKKNVFAMRVGSNVYTLGPGNFVNLKQAQERTKHAKRCRNPSPCTYSNCTYYHDPAVIKHNYNTERNFALSYVMQLISLVKNDTDIVNNAFLQKHGTYKDNFVRDLIQIGGMLIMRGVKVMSLK